MKQLDYSVLKERDGEAFLLEEAPETILQFGEGNFLRAFADYFIDVANEKAAFNSKVVVVQPIAPGLSDIINQQQGLYTLYLRGFQEGQRVEEKRVVSCISRAINPYEDYEALLACARNPQLRYIISNTTEAGIAFSADCKVDDRPPAAFPAKLTRFLLERFNTLGGTADTGLVILACELIDDNGQELKRCVQQTIALWQLEAAFAQWVEEHVLFCSTLVDRIVTGYPAKEADALNEANGYEDKLLVTGEVFGLWVIEGPPALAQALPFQQAGLPVKVVADHSPYKQQKVRILNGAHTSMVPAAYLSGLDIVRDCMADDTLLSFMLAAIHDEIIPTLSLPKNELESFAAAVVERFKNPFIDHSLLAISLNSISKWKARVLPSLKGYLKKTGTLPPRLTFSFAATLAFYSGTALTDEGMTASRDGQPYLVKDDRPILEFFMDHCQKEPAAYVKAVAQNADFWGEDLDALLGFTQQVTGYLEEIKGAGMKAALSRMVAR